MRHLGSRDRYIDWSAQAKQSNIRFIAYDGRFLILSWVRVSIWLRTFLGDGKRTLAGLKHAHGERRAGTDRICHVFLLAGLDVNA